MRAIEALGGLLLITLVPSLMGPAAFGQFSLLQGMSMWFSLLSGVGTLSLMTRFVPEFEANKDTQGLERLATSMLALRTLGGALAGLAYTTLVLLWLRDLDWVPVALVGLSVAVKSPANLTYAVLLGQNHAMRWGMAELLRRGLIAPAVWLGFHWASLRGACWALLLVEILVLILGLWWGRGFLRWKWFRWDRNFLTPYLRFSAGFFAGNIIYTLFTRAGAPLVKVLSGSYADVAQYSIAYGAYLTGTQAMSAVVSALGPRLSALRVVQDQAGLERWTERLLAAGGIVTILSAATIYALADRFAALSLGTDPGQVATMIRIFAVAGVLLLPGLLARVLALINGLPEVQIKGAILQLVVFTALAFILIPWLSVKGAALAILAATLCFSAFTIITLGQRIRIPMRGWLYSAGLAIVLSPVLWPGSPLHWAGFMLLFCGGTIAFRILGREDFNRFKSLLQKEKRASHGVEAGAQP